MATEADNIPAAICETKRELGETTNNSTNTLPQEENTQADTPDEPSTVDGDTKFLKTHAIGEVHSEVNYISPNASKVTNDNEPAVIDKDEDLKRVELFVNEKNNTIALMKEETEKPAESLHIVPDYSSTSNLSQDNEETRSSEERSTNVKLHGIMSDIREGKDTDPLETQKEVLESLTRIVSCSPEEGSTNAVLLGAVSDGIDVKMIDKVDIEKEVPENFSTVGLNEETEEKSANEVDVPDTKAEENLEKEGEKIFSLQHLAREASDNETVVMHEGRSEDGELRKHETGEIETCTKTMSLEKESKMKKPKNSLIVACEETKASKLDHGTDIGSFEEQSAITHPREILDGKTGDGALEAAETKKENLENIPKIASNQKAEELSLIPVDDPQEKNGEHLAKDSEKPSLIEDSGQQIETSSFEEQSRTTYSQTEDGALDAAETKEETLENVSTIASRGKTEKDNLLIQVDSPQKKIKEHLEKNSEKPSLIKDFVGNVNDDESTVLDDVKPEEVSKKEENIESYMLKEEMHMEKPLQSFTAVLEDNKASDLGQDTETTGIHEDHSVTENLQGTLSEKPEEETTDAADTEKRTQEQQQNVATNVSNEDNDKSSSIQLDVSQMKHATLLKKDIENSPSVESSAEDINDESTIMHESRRKVGLLESDKYTDGTLLKKENLGETPEDRKRIASTEYIETTCSPHEQRLITNPPIRKTLAESQGGTIESTLKEDALAEKTVDCFLIETGDTKASASGQVTERSSEEQISPVEIYGWQEPSLKEFSTGNSNYVEPPIIHEPKFEDENLVKADLQDNQKDAESIPGKGKVLIETSSLEVQSLTTNSQEIMSHHKEDKTIDETELEEETHQDENIAITTPYEEAEEIHIQADFFQTAHSGHLENESGNPSLTRDQTGNTTESSLVKEGSATEKLIDSAQAPVQDSSIEETEKDVHCPANTMDSAIIQDMQKLEEAPILLDEEVEEIKEPASIPVPIDFLPESFTETSEIDHSTAERQMTTKKEDLQSGKTPTGDKEKTKLEKDKEEESDEQKISYFSFAALNIIETGGRNGASRSIADVEAKLDDEVSGSTESQEVGSGSVWETSASMYRCERDGYEHAHISTKEKQNSNEVGFAPEESNTGYEARNQVLEYQVQNFGMIAKAEESVDQAAAAELKSETVLAKDRFQPTETMKVHISSEKVSEDPEEAVGKAAEEPEEKLQEANESIASSLQKEQGKCVENAAKISVTGEIHVHIGTQDSGEEVNRSTVPFQEDGDKSTRVDDVENEMAKEKGFQNQNANTSVEDPASGEQSIRPNENKLCEAPSTKTLHRTVEDAEGNKENANTIMIQHQVVDRRSKQESSQLPEFIQGIESEKQAEKDETCSSDEVQIKHEIKAGIPRKVTEDENKKTYVESEKVDFSSHTDDTAKDVPADNENSTTKNENQEIKVPCEGQEPEAIQKGSASETLKQEVQLERNSEPATKAKEVNSPEVEMIDDDCYDLIGNSSSAAAEKILESNADQSSEEDTTRSDKIQESQRQIESLPVVPVTKCSDVEIPEKDLPVQFAGLYSIGGTELTVTPIPSNVKHIVLEADHTKNTNPENLIGNTNISLIEDEHSAKCSEGDHELQKNPVLEPGRASCEHEEQTTQETTKSTQKSEQTANQSADEKEQTPRNEDLQAEKTDEVDHEDTKTDEVKYDEQESSEQKVSELCSEAPIMVDMGDADEKVAHRKSHNILSGVGSKVKHSIAKVKKAITGKSSHTKPSSPK